MLKDNKKQLHVRFFIIFGFWILMCFGKYADRKNNNESNACFNLITKKINRSK